jgi:hypothetical protein
VLLHSGMVERLTKKWCDGFIAAANERLDSHNSELSALESSDYSHPLDTIEAYFVKESETSGDELVPTAFS